MREFFWKFDVGIKLVFLVLLGFLVADRVVGGFPFLPSKTKTPASTEPLVISQPTGTTTTEVDVCGADCQNVVRNLVADAIATVSGQTTTIIKETAVTQKVQSTPRTTFIPLGGSGSTTSQSWVDIKGSDVYISIGDYNNGNVWVGFDATIKIDGGNGQAFARLFDVTHGIAVSGSEVAAVSGDFTVASAENISLWAGNNLYRAQIKSLNGLSTSFSSGRVKIVTK